MRWFVALPTQGIWRKKGCVCLHQQTIDSSRAGDLLNGRRFRVGQIAREGKKEACIERTLRLLRVAGEAVHDARQAARRPVLGDQA